MHPKDAFQYQSHERSTAFQIFSALLVSFPGIASGITMGFSAIILLPLTSQTNKYPLSFEHMSWIASIIYITNMIGSCVGGFISDTWGRKKCLLFGNIVCFIGWIFITIAYYYPQHQFTYLLVGSIITGHSIGTSSVTCLVYTAETSNLKLRPMVTTWFGVSNTIGIFVAYVLGYCFQKEWVVVAIITATMSLGSFLAIAVCLPESQVWLDSKTTRTASVSKTCKLSKMEEPQCGAVEETTVLLRKPESSSSDMERHLPLRERMLQKACLIPTFIIVGYFFFVNFCAFYIIIAYASDFVFLLKINLDPYLTMCIFASARLVAAILISIYSKKMGRRLLSILSGIVMTLSMFLIVLYLYLTSEESMESLGVLFWLPVVLLVVYIFSCTIGFCTIPYAMVGEIFPLNVRGVASGISVCLNCLFTFVAIKIYPSMLIILGVQELLFVYALISLIGTIFIVLFLPETNGKSLKEIENYFESCNSVLKFKPLK